MWRKISPSLLISLTAIGRHFRRSTASLFDLKKDQLIVGTSQEDGKAQLKVQSATASIFDENSDVHFQSKLKNIKYQFNKN